jgi:hypothetical protein
MGMKNHELVPTSLVERIAGLRRGGTRKSLSIIGKMQLVRHEAKICWFPLLFLFLSLPLFLFLVKELT